MFGNIYNTHSSLFNKIDEELAAEDQYNSDKIYQELLTESHGNQDGDSTDLLRIKGGDNAEVYHSIDAKYDINTGEGFDLNRDSNNVRKKVYQQYAYLNNVSLEEAVMTVDRQGLAIENDPELLDKTREYRKSGIINDNGSNVESFDIYNLGRKQYDWAKIDQRERDNIGSGDGFKDSWMYTTGETGAFGRYLSDNEGYVQRSIASGNMMPSAIDTKKKATGEALKEKARKLKLGSYGTTTGTAIMDAMEATSYAYSTDGKYRKKGLANVPTRAMNAIRGAGSTIIEGAYGTVDAASELVGIGSIATEEEIAAYANDATGYDDFYMNDAAREIRNAYRRYQIDGEKSRLVSDAGLSGLGVIPEAAAISMAYVAQLYMPGKALQMGTKIGKLTKTMNSVEKVSFLKLSKDISTLDKVVHRVAGQAGIIGISASHTSNDMDSYKAETGEDMSVIRATGSFGLHMVINNIDGFVGKKMITGDGIGSKAIMNMISKADDGAKVKFVKELTARGFGTAADIVLKEIPTEIIQSGLENISAKYGTTNENGTEKTIGEILTSQEAQEGYITSAAMTPGSVIGMKGLGVGASAVGIGAKKGFNAARSTPTPEVVNPINSGSMMEVIDSYSSEESTYDSKLSNAQYIVRNFAGKGEKTIRNETKELVIPEDFADVIDLMKHSMTTIATDISGKAKMNPDIKDIDERIDTYANDLGKQIDGLGLSEEQKMSIVAKAISIQINSITKRGNEGGSLDDILANVDNIPDYVGNTDLVNTDAGNIDDILNDANNIPDYDGDIDLENIDNILANFDGVTDVGIGGDISGWAGVLDYDGAGDANAGIDKDSNINPEQFNPNLDTKPSGSDNNKNNSTADKNYGSTRTGTHTLGMSDRSIELMAKKLMINPDQLKNAVRFENLSNSIKIMESKKVDGVNVEKKVGQETYNLYFGTTGTLTSKEGEKKKYKKGEVPRDGLWSLFSIAKKHIAAGNLDKSVKAVQKMIAIANGQEKKYKRDLKAYKKAIASIKRRQEKGKKAGKSKEEINAEISMLDYQIVEGASEMTGKDILKDMKLLSSGPITPAQFNELSSTYRIILMNKEFSDNANILLDQIGGIKRDKIVETRYNKKDRAIEKTNGTKTRMKPVEEKLAVLNAKLVELEAEMVELKKLPSNTEEEIDFKNDEIAENKITTKSIKKQIKVKELTIKDMKKEIATAGRVQSEFVSEYSMPDKVAEKEKITEALQKRLGISVDSTIMKDGTIATNNGNDIIERDTYVPTGDVSAKGKLNNELVEKTDELADRRLEVKKFKIKLEKMKTALIQKMENAVGEAAVNKYFEQIEMVNTELSRLYDGIDSNESKLDQVVQDIAEIDSMRDALENQLDKMDMQELDEAGSNERDKEANIDDPDVRGNKAAQKRVRKGLAKWMVEGGSLIKKSMRGIVNIAKRYYSSANMKMLLAKKARLEHEIGNINKRISKTNEFKEIAEGELTAGTSPEVMAMINEIQKKLYRIKEVKKSKLSKKYVLVNRIRNELTDIKNKLFDGSKIKGSGHTQISEPLQEWIKGRWKNGDSEGKQPQVLIVPELGEKANNAEDDTIKIDGNYFNSLEVNDLFEIIDNKKVTDKIEKGMKIISGLFSLGTKGYDKNYKDADWRQLRLAESPFLSILFNSEGKINDNVSAAIVFTASKTIATDGLGLVFNNNDDIARMRDKIDAGFLTDGEKSLLRKGMFMKVYTHGAGGELLARLGIKEHNVPAEQWARLVADAGMYVLRYQIKNNMIMEVDDKNNGISGVDWLLKIERMDNVEVVQDIVALAKKRGVKSPINKPIEMLSPKELISVIAAERRNPTLPTIKMVKLNEASYNTEKKRQALKELRKDITEIDERIEFENIGSKYRTTSSTQEEWGQKRSLWDVPRRAVETLKRLVKQEYRLHIPSIKVMTELFTDENGILDQVALRAHMGWIDTDAMRISSGLQEDGQIDNKKSGSIDYGNNDGIRFSEIEEQEGRNRKIEKTIDEIVELQRRIEQGEMENKLWFDYSFTGGGRFMIESAGINPMTEKEMHRWLVVPIESIDVRWDLSDKNTNTKNNAKAFYDGLAQAFGFDIDKREVSGTKDNAIDFGKALVKLSEDETRTLVNGTGKLAYDRSSDKWNYSAVTNGKPQIDHIGHAAMGIDALRSVRKSRNGKFVATMTVEYDSITSGFANKMYQAPYMDGFKEWAARTGQFFFDENDDAENNIIFINDDQGKKRKIDLNKESMPSILSKDWFSDSYQFLAGKVADKYSGKQRYTGMDNVVAVKEDADPHIPDTHGLWQALINEDKSNVVKDFRDDDNRITSWARTLFKYPFMTFHYASSIKSIGKLVANDLSIDVIDKIIAGKLDDSAAFRARLGLTDDKKWTQLKKDIRTKPTDSVKVNVIVKIEDKKNKQIVDAKVTTSKPLKLVLDDMFIHSYGTTIGEVLHAEFSDLLLFNELATSATRIMFRLYKQKFEEEIKKRTDNGEYVTKEIGDEITKKLHKLFPLIKGPQSETDTDRIGISDKKLIAMDDDSLTYGVVKSKFVENGTDKDGKPVDKIISRSVQIMIRELSEAIKAGASVPFHWIDGAVISAPLMEKGVLGINDAIVSGVDPIGKAKIMNKSALEAGMEYSFMEAIEESLVSTLANVEPIDIAEMKDDTSYVEKETIYIEELLTKIVELNSKIRESRAKIFSNKIVVKNISAPLGSEYVYEGKIAFDAKKKYKDVVSEEVFNRLLDEVNEECR